MQRRTFLQGAAAVTLAALAGCTGPAQSPPVDETRYLTREPDYRGWFDNVSNYERTVDARGTSAVNIEVGASANNGRYGFGPAAVAVSPGTTVTWKWSGKGGMHNVHAESGAFESDYSDAGGYTYSFTFDDPRIYKYQCDPHATMGMRGAVVVALE